MVLPRLSLVSTTSNAVLKRRATVGAITVLIPTCGDHRRLQRFNQQKLWFHWSLRVFKNHILDNMMVNYFYIYIYDILWDMDMGLYRDSWCCWCPSSLANLENIDPLSLGFWFRYRYKIPSWSMDVNGGYKLTHDWINGSILWNPFFFFKYMVWGTGVVWCCINTIPPNQHHLAKLLIIKVQLRPKQKSPSIK